MKDRQDLEPTPREIQNMTFRIARNGYDREDVHAYLYALGLELDALLNRPKAPDDPPLGSEVSEILRAAKDSAARIRSQAESEAASILNRAETEADELRSVAISIKEEAEALFSSVQERAESLRSQRGNPQEERGYRARGGISELPQSQEDAEAEVLYASRQASALLDIAKEEAEAITEGIASMRRNAEREADSVVRRAEADAATIRSQGESAYAVAVREAAAEADRMREEARIEITRLLAETENRVTTLREMVELETTQKVEAAERRVQEMRELEATFHRRFASVEDVLRAARGELEPGQEDTRRHD